MPRGRTYLSAIVASLLVSVTPLRSNDTIAEVPFELYQRHLVVTKGSIGRLNGLSLLIDTGSIPSMVDARIARKLHLNAGPSMLIAFGQQIPIQSATLEGFRIGSLHSGPVPTGIGDLSYLEGVHIDAIVGLDVLARTSFSIDYQNHVLGFSPAGRENSVAPLELAWPFLTVRMTIAGQQVRLLVDTGSSDLVLFKERGCPPPSPVRPGGATRPCSTRPASARLKRLELRQVGLGEQIVGQAAGLVARSGAPGLSREHRRRAWCAVARLPARAVRLRAQRVRLEPVNRLRRQSQPNPVE